MLRHVKAECDIKLEEMQSVVCEVGELKQCKTILESENQNLKVSVIYLISTTRHFYEHFF